MIYGQMDGTRASCCAPAQRAYANVESLEEDAFMHSAVLTESVAGGEVGTVVKTERERERFVGTVREWTRPREN